jgi:catechol 2,3-dioxygenase-like lactoylglutathione lyase family enzyme
MGVVDMEHGIHHIGLLVRNLDEARRFYGDVLGLTQRTDAPNRVGQLWFDAGDGQIRMVEGPQPVYPDGAPAYGPHVALIVDDVAGMVEHLRGHDIEVEELTAPWLNAMFRDPSGNEIEIRRPPEVWAARVDPTARASA